MAVYIIPVILILLLIYCFVKKVNAYDHFVNGAKGAIDLCVNTFPYLVAIFCAVELFKLSGLSTIIANFTAPFFNFLGIPSELIDFLILRPFSGSGSVAMVSEIYAKYGVDSYISKCASVILSSSETVFYIIAVYFSTTKIKKLKYAIPIALLSVFIGTILSCLICRIL